MQREISNIVPEGFAFTLGQEKKKILWSLFYMKVFLLC